MKIFNLTDLKITSEKIADKLINIFEYISA